ncbi:hypothetical protein CHARACLAT_029202 [Characodon lateralis]|uniref:Uncharacterized protein n=1 Tax=Characodon lateralis TaxID=208331 RepID=A0ABU7DYF9_9TELE|nr:hypothetical protein [Characodon lateralis]
MFLICGKKLEYRKRAHTYMSLFQGSASLCFISTHSQKDRVTVGAALLPSSTGPTLFLCFMLQCSNHYRPDVNGGFVKLQRTEGWREQLKSTSDSLLQRE